MAQTTIQLQIHYFSILSQIAQKRTENLSLKAGQNLNDLLQILEGQYPEIKKYLPYVRIAVNQTYSTLDYQPADNDEIALITPVSGG